MKGAGGLIATTGGERGERTVLVRFRDNEVLEGTAKLDFDRPDLELEIADLTTNNRSVLVPFSAVKSILLERREVDPETEDGTLEKVAVHFWDGEVLRGLIGQEPGRHVQCMTLPLVSPALDEIEVFAIPYTAVKGVFQVKSWDSRSAEFLLESGKWTFGRADTPLLDLLGEIRGLTKLRSRGHLSDAEFEKRRREVLERI
jgi:hypothetical protein